MTKGGSSSSLVQIYGQKNVSCHNLLQNIISWTLVPPQPSVWLAANPGKTSHPPESNQSTVRPRPEALPARKKGRKYATRQSSCLPSFIYLCPFSAVGYVCGHVTGGHVLGQVAHLVDSLQESLLTLGLGMTRQFLVQDIGAITVVAYTQTGAVLIIKQQFLLYAKVTMTLIRFSLNSTVFIENCSCHHFCRAAWLF